MRRDRVNAAREYLADPAVPAPLRQLLADLIDVADRRETTLTTPDAIDRFWARVDKGPSCWLWTGPRKNNGYGQVWHRGRSLYVHRVAYELTMGPIPDGQLVDHVCRVRHCIRPSHLRLATYKQNAENHERIGAGATGVRGVVRRRSGSYVGQVRHFGKIHRAGTFPTLEEAEQAVVALRLALYTHNDADRH